MRLPYSGTSMISIGLKGMHHSSLTPYSALNFYFVYKSLKVAQSSGESDGTDVTIPVPLFIDMDFIGKVYTTS